MPKLFVVLIFLGFIAVAVPHLDSLGEAPYAARTEVAEPSGYGPRSVSLEADRRGHFIVDAVINGRTITMLADTGASAVVLTESDARRAGFEPRSLEFDVPVKTANGESRAAAIRLDSVDVGGIRLDDVRAMVVREGDLDISLLGMSYIGRLSSFNMAGGRLELVK